MFAVVRRHVYVQLNKSTYLFIYCSEWKTTRQDRTVMWVIYNFFLNGPFPSFFEPHYQSEASYIVLMMKISFHSYANKSNLSWKALHLAKLS